MDTELYYFSATGNTLAVAREIAKRLGAKLIPIPQAVTQDRVIVRAPNICVVFPSYIAPILGVPLIVERFIQKIENIDQLRITAVCTCGGYELVNALPSLRMFSRIVRSRGGNVAAAHSIRLPMNNLDYDHIPIPIERDSGVIIQKSRKKIEDICTRMERQRRAPFANCKALFLCIVSPLFGLMKQPILKSLREKAQEPADSELQLCALIPLTDKSITVSDACTGCGTCARLCPARNIRIADGKPVFLHNCEMCFACDEWCPSGAIHHWSRQPGVKYHHPDIRLADLLPREQPGE